MESDTRTLIGRARDMGTNPPVPLLTDILGTAQSKQDFGPEAVEAGFVPGFLSIDPLVPWSRRVQENEIGDNAHKPKTQKDRQDGRVKLLLERDTTASVWKSSEEESERLSRLIASMSSIGAGCAAAPGEAAAGGMEGLCQALFEYADSKQKREVHGVKEVSSAKAARDRKAHLRQLVSIAKVLPPGAISAVVAACVQGGHWPLLRVLLDAQLVTVSSCPVLVRSLLREGQLALVERVMLQVKDVGADDLKDVMQAVLSHQLDGDEEGVEHVSPAVLAKAMEYLAKVKRQAGGDAVAAVGRLLQQLQTGERTDKRKTVAKQKREEEGTIVRAMVSAAAIDGFSSQELCLHALLAAPRDEVVLSAALQDLRLSEVASLIAYLSKWMHKYSSSGSLWGLQSTPANTPPSLPVPKLEHLVAWCSALLDCHLVKLSLLPQCLEELRIIQVGLEAHIAVLNRLGGLLGPIHHVCSLASSPQGQLPGLLGATGNSLLVVSDRQLAAATAVHSDAKYMVEVINF